jgi:hypothetical protein
MKKTFVFQKKYKVNLIVKVDDIRTKLVIKGILKNEFTIEKKNKQVVCVVE